MLVLKNALTLDGRKDILIEGEKITRIVDAGELKTSADEVIDCAGKAVIPGLVNTHTHLPMSLFRGLADDLPLMEWLEKHIWPAEDKHLSKEFCYYGALLSCIEMIKTGTTVFVDMYTFEKEMKKAVEESGMRAFLTEAILDFKTKDYEAGQGVSFTEKLLKEEKNTSLVKIGVGPHSPYTCSEETLVKSKELAEKHNALLHIHLSETKKEVEQVKEKTGKRPAEYLESIGFFDYNKIIAAHCVWLDEKEISILAEHGVTVSHNPVSNAKLASGIAPIPLMLSKGVNVTIGTDGCASNNTLDLFESMKMTALIHKAKTLDPTTVNARQVINMVTENAYKALGLNIGLREGAAADLVIIDLKKPHLTPIYSFESHLVYAAKSSDVDTVIINGSIVMKNRKILTINEEKVMEKANELAEAVGK